MTEVFLGVIAVGVAVMAAVQVAAILAAAKALRRMADAVTGLERDVRPIVANLQTMSADAARAAAQAAAQVDKADRLINAVSKKVEDTVASIQDSVVQPARDGLAVLHGLKAALSAFRDSGSASPRKPSSPAATPDEEELFIG